MASNFFSRQQQGKRSLLGSLLRKATRNSTAASMRRLTLERVEDRRLLTTIDLATLATDEGAVIYGAEAGDRTGWNSSNAGDFNGDGYDDLLIGASGGDGSSNNQESAGEAYIVFGGPSFPATLDLENLGSNGVTLYGADAGDRVGFHHTTSSAGDVNGDGYEDILLGTLYGNGPGNNRADAGEVYLIFGSAGPTSVIDLGSLGSSGTTIYGAQAGDKLSRVSDAGDVNGDGYDDILLGAIDAGTNGQGEAYVIFGGTALPTTIDLASSPADVTLVGRGLNFGNGLGNAGDFNGDNVDDFIVGDNSANGTGEAYIFFGSPSLPSMIDLNTSGSADVMISGVSSESSIGLAVDGVGDMNGDGYDDVVLGDRVDANYVVFGSASPGATMDLANLGSDGFVLNGVGSLRGVRAAGDINGDGLGDVVVGNRSDDGVGGLRENSGTTYVVFGSTTLGTEIDVTNLGSSGLTFYGADAGDQSGAWVGSAGDFDGDGIDDLMIGATSSAGVGNSEAGAGETYVLYGRDFSSPPSVSISVSDASVTEGGQLAFEVTLSAASNDTVTVDFGTADETAFAGNDYVSASGQLTFVPGGALTQTVYVTTVDDSSDESDETLSLALFSPVNAALGDFDATGTIIDNDSGPGTKFYVANDASNDKTYEYAADGTAIENYSLDGLNSAPRGVATTAAGDKVWVVDASLNVYVYDSGGNPLGSWYASGIGTASKLQGIATDGIDIWIVDDKFNKVHRFADAANVTSGVEYPSHSFDLIKGNKKPTGMTTDGTHLWIVNNGNRKDKVFKYELDGTNLGNWKINTPGVSQPTGITLDPSGASDSLWIVDKGTDRVYEYANALNKTGGKLAASADFALASGNTNPQGIADPPPVGNYTGNVSTSAIAAFPLMAPSLPACRPNMITSELVSDDLHPQLTPAAALRPRSHSQFDEGTRLDGNQRPAASETFVESEDSTAVAADEVFSGDESFDYFDDTLVGLVALKR